MAEEAREESLGMLEEASLRFHEAYGAGIFADYSGVNHHRRKDADLLEAPAKQAATVAAAAKKAPAQKAAAPSAASARKVAAQKAAAATAAAKKTSEKASGKRVGAAKKELAAKAKAGRDDKEAKDLAEKEKQESLAKDAAASKETRRHSPAAARVTGTRSGRTRGALNPFSRLQEQGMPPPVTAAGTGWDQGAMEEDLDLSTLEPLRLWGAGRT
ncbi:hypothetical protein CYMTET_42171 [Cymbomonas tetramitiformis]|uniref:Uncharacterized protein n=1 Tax=Cymbomonas tetramitiformis TaxID=36881 RepID=A0AAE0C6C1_9CHLO|nr:hypothetical protein CYMTET_42171 [Cymbomonas tetramitiformis]